MNKLPFDLGELQVFLDLAQTKSVTQTAAHFDVRQPTVSLTIHQLEKKLGRQLFDRNFRPMRLTRTGEALLGRVEGLLRMAEGIRDEVNASLKTRRITIGWTDGLNNDILVNFMRELADKAALVNVEVGKSSIISQKLLEGSLEVILGARSMSGFPNIVALPCLRERFIVITKRGDPAPLDTMEDLQRYAASRPFLGLYPNLGGYQAIMSFFKENNIPYLPAFQVNSHRVIISAVAHGMGWSILPVLALYGSRDKLERVGLHALPWRLTRTLNVLYRQADSEWLAHAMHRSVSEYVSREVAPLFAGRIPVSIEVLPE